MSHRNIDKEPYRPKSPDLSKFQAPPPRLSRVPSYKPDQSVPPGYTQSPRGSYDASPYFSPQTATAPSTSYFGPRAPPSAASPPPFRTPHPPPHSPGAPHPHHLAGPVYSNVPPATANQHPPFPPTAAAPYYGQPPHPPHAPPGLDYPPLYGDMPRTRQRKAEELDPNFEPPHAPPPGVPVEPEPLHPSQSVMPMVAGAPGYGIDVRTKFPVARIKRIMQADEEVGKVAQATPTAVSKALELFMIDLVVKSAGEARLHGSKRVTAQHLKAALMKDTQFDFLTEICDNVPDESAKKGRAKSEAKSEDSDDDIAPKKKAKGGKKRRAGSDDDSD